MTISKYQLRQDLLKKCQAVTARMREQAAVDAASLLRSQSLFKTSEAIACYLPTQFEFDASKVIEAIWHAKKICYVPKLSSENEKQLQFVQYNYGDALHLNKFSILEPSDKNKKILPSALDIVFTPLYGFNRQGHRLGTGGGYYDRTFAFLLADNALRKPRMVGLGYSFQEVPQLPMDPWDVVLDDVLTENEWIQCRK